jgi:SPP1 gp7 family putative phage head morphogenesis protein
VKFDLSQMVRRPSKRPIVLANVKPTQAQADDLATLYLRVVARWTAAIDRIIAAYSAALSRLQTDSANDAGSTIDSVDAEVQRLILLLTPELRDWALKVERVHRGKWAANVLSAASVDLSTVLSASDVSETVDAVVNWNAALVADVSDEAKRRIANAVFAGLQQRKPADEVAREIRDITGMARARARRVASDQTVKLGARLNQARQEQAGISRFVWVHSAKAHPRLWHLARNGKVFEWSDPKIASDLPGYAPFCGCTGRAYMSFDDK